MANKKLRFVALIAVMLVLVCMLVACTTTSTKATYNVILHLGDGQSDITWDRQTDFPTLAREHYTCEGLYLDAEFKTATSVEELKEMWLTADIDVYVNWTKVIYKITVHPANGEQDVIWEPAPGNKIPAFTKVGYIMSGFYFDENCTQPADSVFTEELLEHKEVWVKWSECDHKAVTEWTTDKPATCTEDGHKIATCPTCGKELEDTIAALGHNSDGIVAHKDADCTHDGVVGGSYCTGCGLGRADAEKTIKALGHSYGTVSYVWSADNKTCTASRTCANDASHVETETVNVKATVVQNKTCTLDELTTYVATFENSAFATQTKANIKTADKTGHEYGKASYVWPADNKQCTATRTCTNTGCTHAETETVDTKATVTQHSSCTTVERTTFVATFENSAFAEQKKENVQTANAGEHNYTEFVKYTKEPTCTEGGKAIYKCGGCSGTKELDVDALGHNHDGNIAHKDADCTHDGVVGGKYCTRCNDGKEAAEATIDALGHNSEGHVDHVEAKCTEDGVVGGTYCTRCNDGKEAAEKTIDALGHNSEGHVDHVDAKCTEDGVVGGTYCTRCNDGKAAAEATIDALGHNSEGTIAHKDANCTEAGVVGGTYCTRCNEGKAAAEKTIDALGHNSEGHVDHVDAKCTEAGVVGGTYCTRCNGGKEAAETAIKALGHTPTHTEQKDATCGTTGNIEYWYCSGCETYFSDEACTTTITVSGETDERVILATGKHTYTFVTEKPATASEAGTKAHYHCDGCGKDFDLNKAEVSADDLVIEAGTTATYTSTIVIADYAKANDWTASSKQYTEVGNDIFTVNVSYKKGGTNTGKYYEDNAGNQWRIYESEDASIVIATADGKYKLMYAAFTFTAKSSNNGVLLNGTEQVKSGTSVEITGDSITFGVGHSSGSKLGQARITKIEVVYSYKSNEEMAQAKADEIANNLTLNDIKLSNVGDKYEELPTSKDGATITWSVADDNGYVSCESNILTVTTKPVGTEAKVSLTATVSVTINGVTKTAEKPFTDIITVYADEIKHTVSITTNKLVTITITDGVNTINAGDQVVDNTTLIIDVALNTSNNGTYTFVVKNGDKELLLEDGHYSVQVNADVNISVVTTPVLDTPEQIVGAAYDLEDGKDLGKQTLEGKVTKIDTAYSTQYSNISVTIQIGELTDNTILCFRMKGAGAEYIAVGDTIKVTGTLKNYHDDNNDTNTIEFIAGCTFEYISEHSVTVSIDENIKATVTYFGDAITGEKEFFGVTKCSEFVISITLDDGYKAIVTVNGTANDVTASGDFKVTVTGNTTITITTEEKSTSGGEDSGSTSAETTETITIANMGWTNGTKYSSIDKTAYTITASGGDNTGKYYSSKEWRIYQTESPSVKIEAKTGYSIVSVKITYGINNSGVLTKDGNNITSDKLVTVNASSVTFGVGNTGTKTNGQVRITAIEIVYKVA